VYRWALLKGSWVEKPAHVTSDETETSTSRKRGPEEGLITPRKVVRVCVDKVLTASPLSRKYFEKQNATVDLIEADMAAYNQVTELINNHEKTKILEAELFS